MCIDFGEVLPRIRLHCVFRIDLLFFAVVENERTEVVTIVRLSEAEFEFLRRIGVPLCMEVTS